MNIYRQFWNAAEMRPASHLVGELHREPSLFMVRERKASVPVHAGPLSVKTVVAGRSRYLFGSQCYTVSPGQLLLVSEGSSYSTHVDETGANIATLYFPRILVGQMLRLHTATSERLLEDQTTPNISVMEFAPHHRAVDPRFKRLLKAVAKSDDPGDRDDRVNDLLDLTVALAMDAAHARKRVPAAKAAVRQELFRRVCIARQAIEDTLNTTMSLDNLARVANLSPFHLQRVFRAAFGESPNEMRRRRRMDLAKQLLDTTHDPINAIASTVGYDNVSAFIRAFRICVGLSPLAYRER
jgi:AraC family transcriptional regulator